MVSIHRISRFLNRELKIKNFKEDLVNGMQVGINKDIEKIGFAVDACIDTFRRAIKAGCELLITHHGILWKFKDSLKRPRIEYLKKHRLSLYSVHQPLDIHPVYGNNILIANHLNLKKIRKFGKNEHGYWGYRGDLTRAISLRQLVKNFTKLCGKPLHILNNGNIPLHIGIVTGSGSWCMEEAKKNCIDTVITGEIKHSTYHKAKELKLNVIAGGHYATETLGIKSLKKLLKSKFNLKMEFIDIPTDL